MFMHIITWFVVEIEEVLLIPAEELWMNVNRIKFGHWLQSNSPQSFSFANKCMNSLASMFETLPLRFCLSNSKANVPRSDFRVNYYLSGTGLSPTTLGLNFLRLSDWKSKFVNHPFFGFRGSLILNLGGNCFFLLLPICHYSGEITVLYFLYKTNQS